MLICIRERETLFYTWCTLQSASFHNSDSLTGNMLFIDVGIRVADRQKPQFYQDISIYKGPGISMSYLGFQNRNLRVWSCSQFVAVMTLKLLHVGELCTSVPLLSSLDVEELPSTALAFLVHLGFAVTLYELFSAVG